MAYLFNIAENETYQKEIHQIIIIKSLSLKEHMAVMRQYEENIILNIKRREMLGGFIKKWDDHYQTSLMELNKINEKLRHQKDKDLIKKMIVDLQDYKANIQWIIEKISGNIIQSHEEAIEAMSKYKKSVYDYNELIDSILNMSHENMRNSFDGTIDMSNKIIRVMIIVSFVSLILIILAIRFFIIHVINPVSHLKANIDSISREGFSGFVDIDLEGNNELTELAASFNRLVKLRIKAEMELLDYKNQLELKVEERASEIIEINKRLKEEIENHRIAAKACSISEEKFRGIASSAPDAIIMVNRKGEIVFFNESAERIFGFTRDEIINKVLSKVIIPPDMQESFRREFRDFDGITVGLKKSIELMAKRKDGTGFPIELSVSSIKIGDDWNSIGIIRDITNRKKYEREISRLATVIEQVNESVVITDLNGNIEYVNPYFEKATGYSAGEAIGNNPKILKSGMQKNEVYAGMWQAIKNGTTWQGHFINRRKDGTLYDEEANIFPIKDSSGKIINYATVKRDITDKLLSEEKIRAQNEFLSSVLNSLTHPFYVINADNYEIVMGNESGAWNPDMKGAKCYEINHGLTVPCDETLFPCPIKEIRKTNRSSVMEHMFFDAAGEEKYKEIYGYPIFDKQGKMIQIIEYITDITNRKMTEKELLKFSRAVEQSLNIIVITDTDAVIEYVNPKFFEITGFTRDDIFGKKATLLGEQSEDERRKFWELLIENEEWQGEFHNKKKNGEYYWEYATITPIKDSNATITNYLKVGTDITKRKQIEKELQEAKIEAEKASYFKSQFLANMSHEIRTPMNSILGFMDLIKKTKLDDRQQEYMSIISKSAGTLLEIIDEILDFSSIESGIIKMDIMEFSPVREFEILCEFFSVIAEKKGIQLLFFIDPNLPETLEGSLIRIKQVLMNLIGNAIKFTPENGRIIVDITLMDSTEGFCRINFSVSDSGIGIPEDKQKVIFESFVQADSSITRKFGGTGLGLAISTNFVKLMGGDIKLTSKEGEGSCFFFDIAFRMVKKGVSPGSLVKKKGIKPVIYNPRGLHDIQADLLAKYLGSLGLDPKEINDGHDLKNLSADTSAFLISSPHLHKEIAGLMEETKLKDIIVICREKDSRDDAIIEMPIRKAKFLYTPINCTKLLLTLDIIKNDDVADIHEEKAGEKGHQIYRSRVLVAEDNDINQKLITILLQDLGIDVDMANDGLEAVEMFKKNEYDLVLMDLHMPVMNGIDAAGEIMQYQRKNGITDGGIPVIALTADVINIDLKNLNEKGISDIMSKPITGNKLSSVLKKYLKLADKKFVEEDSMQGKDIIEDLDKTAKILSIGRDVLLSLIKKFLSKSDEYMGNLESCLSNDDQDKLYKEAHKIKGAASNLRLNNLAEIASDIESSAKNRNDCNYREKLDRLADELKKLAGTYGRIEL